MSAATLIAVAADLHDRADALRLLAARMALRSRSARWSSTGAVDFRARVDEIALGLRRQAGAVDDVADHVSRRAVAALTDPCLDTDGAVCAPR